MPMGVGTYVRSFGAYGDREVGWVCQSCAECSVQRAATLPRLSAHGQDGLDLQQFNSGMGSAPQANGIALPCIRET